jgi:hypothetical protein
MVLSVFACEEDETGDERPGGMMTWFHLYIRPLLAFAKYIKAFGFVFVREMSRVLCIRCVQAISTFTMGG